ncbi:MAG: hypothetical protein OXE50_16305 [Chloroflexi bacterium]|nr:hypothetical protein [Chloroflexota bacterium]
MKFLKISSLLVLSLLLCAPSAMAAVTCELESESRRIRMESMHEMVGDDEGMLEVKCTWASEDIDIETVTTAAVSTFDLELHFEGELSTQGDDVNMAMAMLTLMDADGDDADTDPDSRMAAVESVGRDSLYWEDVPFPTSWTVGTANNAADTTEDPGTFMISGIYIDATSVGDTRLEAAIEMTGNNVVGNDDLTEDAEAVSVNRVDQALELNFAEDNKANSKVNACVPGSFDITVELEEGFRMAWMPGNDIKLMVSSGKITAKDTAPFDITGEGAADELIIEVAQTSGTNTGDLAIKFEPAAGTVGDDIVLSAMILPTRRSDEAFAYSDELVVGTYVACSGDTLFFPFVTSMSGWDTGIVVVNDSEVDGSCSLNWGNMKLDDDEMEALSTIDVDAKDHMAFLVSGQRGADYSGSVGVKCSFGSATGYVFLSDAANGIGQGYLVTVTP